MAARSSAGRRLPAVAEWRVPTRGSAAIFAAKVLCHRVRRGLIDLRAGPHRLSRADHRFPLVVAESRTPLWSEAPPTERRHQLGKVHNLRRAVRRLDGVAIGAGDVFSFWKQVGRASRRRGFVIGRMLQEGCLVPAVGGGLCQLSNALYDVALRAGCEIVERHAHSRRIPGSAAAIGRDATVAWNYVDLRFRPRQALQLEARLEREDLVVRLRAMPQSDANVARRSEPAVATGLGDPFQLARSCATCGETGCFRHERPTAAAAGVAAFLVDENWPEFQAYVARAHAPGDVLGVPLDGEYWRLARYRWPTRGFRRVGTASIAALLRARASRRLPAQGAARRAAELAAAERIACRLARLLTPDVTKVCVAQPLLPFLWREGHLGGREVEVLMTRLPIAELQARLDRAAALHPDRETLRDFRAPPWLVTAEAEGLAYAARIVTPHGEAARQFPEKAVLLEWRLPDNAGPVAAPRSNRIAFPGPTVARKGAYEVREAARALDLDVVLLGSELEGAGFWEGVRTLRPESGGDWLKGVAAVVQPAIVEERPRHLLATLAAGIPIIATAACGLPPHDLVTIVPESDPEALIEALRKSLA